LIGVASACIIVSQITQGNHHLFGPDDPFSDSLLGFSKKLANHIWAIKYFICHYNLTRAVALPV
jgi:hypothetical protein